MSKKLTRKLVRQVADICCTTFDVLHPGSLDYSPTSLKHLDDAFDLFHLEGCRSDEMTHVCFTTGCYLAEVMCRHLPDTRWSAVEKSIVLNDTGHINVLQKPAKRLDNGPEDSLFDFYQTGLDLALGRIDLGRIGHASGDGRPFVLWRHANGLYTVEQK